MNTKKLTQTGLDNLLNKMNNESINDIIKAQSTNQILDEVNDYIAKGIEFIEVEITKIKNTIDINNEDIDTYLDTLEDLKMSWDNADLLSPNPEIANTSANLQIEEEALVDNLVELSLLTIAKEALKD